MDGYDDRTYGESMADVYDDWYADVTDVDATVALVAELAGPEGRVLELGVGTGRLAVPLALAGLDVVGIDASAAMLDRLARRDGGDAVRAVLGDMVDDLPAGPFDAALVAYNTIFNLTDATRQQACFRSVAERLAPGGAFVVEAFVPTTGGERRESVTVRSLAVGEVVLSVSVDDPSAQRAEGQFVHITEAHGVRLRPWSIRWSTPEQLDEMAAIAGLVLTERFEDATRAAFDDNSPTHVSIYRPSRP
jgi:SAM-dependent methyltransferase